MDIAALLCSTASSTPFTQERRKEPTLSTSYPANLPHTLADPPHTAPSASHLPTSVPKPIRRVTFSQNENLDSLGTSTWQSRNPTNSVLLPRIRAGQHKSDAEKASVAARSLKRKEKTTDLEEAIQAIIDNRDDAIQELAQLHSVSVKCLAKRVNATSNYHPTRGPNIFNALVSLASVELNEGQPMIAHCWEGLTDNCQGREEGNRLKLSEVQAIVKKDMNTDKISDERQAEALSALKEARKVHTMGSRSSNVAAQGDARGTVDRLSEEVSPTRPYSPIVIHAD